MKLRQPHLQEPKHYSQWRRRLFRVIFGYHTFAGKLFDVLLLLAILISVVAVMLESIPSVRKSYGTPLLVIEWILTGAFTLEYIARILCHPKPKKYIFSFMGLVDLLSIVPTYLSLFTLTNKSLSVIRTIRLIRIFRILKLTQFVGGAQIIRQALWDSRHKIIVFLGSILCIVSIVGTLIFVIEGPEHGFTSIPKSIYWAIVTLTTVGYGDLSPQTGSGQILASIIMILGYAIIAVPTGIVTGEMIKGQKVKKGKCPKCFSQAYAPQANYCYKCGTQLGEPTAD